MDSKIDSGSRPVGIGILLIVIFFIFFWYVPRKHKFWSRLGVNGPKPLYLVGNLERINKPVTVIEPEWTQKYGNLYGYYLGWMPVLTVSEPELIKQIMVRDFHHFVNRIRANAHHEIMTEHLFLLEGERWKRVRTIVTPTFTSGKLRGMQSLMNRAVDKLSDYFNKLTLNNGTGTISTKEVIAGFTIDVIATTTFATQTNSNDDRSKQNTFVENGLKMFDINPLKFISLISMPKWLNQNVFGIEYLPPKKPAEFFMNLTRNIVRQRKLTPSSGNKRNDLVQLLLDASVVESELKNTNWNSLTASVAGDQEQNDKKSETSHYQEPSQSGETAAHQGSQIRRLTENEIIAQCIIFFIAGFETTASTISHCLFELAKNPAIQQRLYDKLCSILGDRDTVDKLDTSTDEYFKKVINQIPYLEAVIKETLRKYPPVIRINRRVTSERYQLTDQLELKKDQLVEVPIYSIHNNPQYYPEPERFDPERFMPENQHLLIPYTFLPFGVGPRNCVGMRFAYQEVKLMLAQIVPRYRFDITENTPERLHFDNRGPLMIAKSFELSISKRQ